MKITFDRILNKIKKHTIGLELSGFKRYEQNFRDKQGIEIGGPSGIFKHNQILPLYALAESVDGVNFSTQTVWENTITEGNTYRYESDKVGYQYILEASNLAGIDDDKYDFLLSSHSLEHCANPIKTIVEWKRVVKGGGCILLILPNKEVTFDHQRPITQLTHLEDDFKNDTQEDDLTHVEEILKLHDISRDPGVSSTIDFRSRSYDNLNNRCLHHHVFDISLMEQLFRHIGMKVIYTDSISMHLIAMAIKE